MTDQDKQIAKLARNVTPYHVRVKWPRTGWLTISKHKTWTGAKRKRDEQRRASFADDVQIFIWTAPSKDASYKRAR